MKVTLASSSKFKSSILTKCGIKHDTIDTNSKEISSKTNIYEYAMEISAIKAYSAANKVTDGIVIGLDTVVNINGKIVEKPRDLEEAKNNLRNSSKNKTKVITGLTIINLDTEQVKTTFQETVVTMREITEEEIEFYINNEKDVMYASGFIIETIASCYLDKIEGSFYNILGVPVEKIYEIIKNQGVTLKDID